MTGGSVWSGWLVVSETLPPAGFCVFLSIAVSPTVRRIMSGEASQDQLPKPGRLVAEVCVEDVEADLGFLIDLAESGLTIGDRKAGSDVGGPGQFQFPERLLDLEVGEGLRVLDRRLIASPNQEVGDAARNVGLEELHNFEGA